MKAIIRDVFRSICACVPFFAIPAMSMADGEAQEEAGQPACPVYAIYMPGLSQISTASGNPFQPDCIRLPLSGGRDIEGVRDPKKDLDIEISAAIDAGITGFIFAPAVMSNDKNRTVALDNYAQWLNAAGRHSHFQIPFMMDCNGSANPADAAAMAEMFLSRFGNDPRVPHSGGLPMITVYDPDAYTPETWASIFKSLSEKGLNASWIGGFTFLYADADVTSFTAANKLKAYLDAGFNGLSDARQHTSTSLFAARLRSLRDAMPDKGLLEVSPLVEYLQRGYQIFVPPNGTENFRSSLQAILDLDSKVKVNFIGLYSWNDFSENHHVAPSFHKGRVRSEILKHYSSLLNGLKAPVYQNIHLYLSFRRSVSFGESVEVEALRFPSAAGLLNLTLELRGEDGKSLRRGPFPMDGTSLQAQKALFSTCEFPASRALRLYATIADNTGKSTERFVELMHLSPGLHEDLVTESLLLDEMPEVPSLEMKDSLLCAKDNGNCVRLQILRNLTETVAESPSCHEATQQGMRHVRVSINLASSTNADRSPHYFKGVLQADGGRIIRGNVSSHALDSNGRHPASSQISSEGVFSFSVSNDGAYYFSTLYADAFVNPSSGQFVLQCEGLSPFCFTYNELMSKRILAHVWDKDGCKAAVLLVGGEDNPGYDGKMGKTSQISADTASSPLAAPVDIYYARAFTADGAWCDSEPVVIRHASGTTVKMPCIDPANNKICDIDIDENEATLVDYKLSEGADDFFLVRDASMRGKHTALPSGYCMLGHTTGSHLSVNGCDPLRKPTDKANGTLVFDGHDGGNNNACVGCVSVPYCIPYGAAFTIDMLLNIQKFDVERTIISDRTFGGNHGTLCLRIENNGLLKVSRKGEDVWDDFVSTRPLTAGGWHRVSLSDDLVNLTLYIDGVPAGSISSGKREASYVRRPFYHLIGSELVGSGCQSKPFLGMLAHFSVTCVPFR